MQYKSDVLAYSLMWLVFSALVVSDDRVGATQGGRRDGSVSKHRHNVDDNDGEEDGEDDEYYINKYDDDDNEEDYGFVGGDGDNDDDYGDDDDTGHLWDIGKWGRHEAAGCRPGILSGPRPCWMMRMKRGMMMRRRRTTKW